MRGRQSRQRATWGLMIRVSSWTFQQPTDVRLLTGAYWLIFMEGAMGTCRQGLRAEARFPGNETRGSKPRDLMTMRCSTRHLRSGSSSLLQTSWAGTIWRPGGWMCRRIVDGPHSSLQHADERLAMKVSYGETDIEPLRITGTKNPDAAIAPVT